MTTLENDFLRISVKHIGAELTHLFNKQTSIEYLWQGGEAWPKHAPVLFPVVGQLKENKYIYNNHAYILERHGFARTKIFSVHYHSPEKIIFVLNDDMETWQKFPFHFRLLITYELKQNTLLVAYEVKNTSSVELFFSLGAHPAFNVPLLAQEYYSDYYLEFSKKEYAKRWLLQNGLIDKPVDYLTGDHILPLSHSLFKDDALVFKQVTSEMISLRCRKSEHGLHFRMKGYPYLGIWAAKNANFVCIEPWHGIADSVNAQGNLIEKEGIIHLAENEQFSCNYSLETF